MDEPLIRELTVEAMYGLVLVMDPESLAVEVPVTGNECSSTRSCVAVPIRPYVDGPVSLWLGPTEAISGGTEIFSGALDTPTGKLAITLPEESELVSINVAGAEVEISIAVDEPTKPIPSVGWRKRVASALA